MKRPAVILAYKDDVISFASQAECLDWLEMQLDLACHIRDHGIHCQDPQCDNRCQCGHCDCALDCSCFDAVRHLVD